MPRRASRRKPKQEVDVEEEGEEHSFQDDESEEDEESDEYVQEEEDEEDEDSDDEDDDDDDDDDELEYTPASSKATKRAAIPKRGRPRKRPFHEDSLAQLAYQSTSRGPSRKGYHHSPYSDGNEEDLEEKETLQSLRSSKTRKRNRVEKEEEEDDDDDDDNDDEDIGRLSRPTRVSASQATQRIVEQSQSWSDDEDEEEDNKKLQTPTSKTKKGFSSDEEFVADSASEPSSEEASFDGADSDFYSDADDNDIGNRRALSKGKGQRPVAVNIDDEQVGTAEESSEEDDDDESKSDGFQVESQQQQQPAVIDIDDEQVGTADESSDDDYNDEHVRRPISSRQDITPLPKTRSSDSEDSEFGPVVPSPLRLPPCPSTTDAITLEPLPRKHVCYISPDGLSRQCFALETLRQISLKCAILHFRVDLDGERQTFLQPPHFRTPMSDDLLDQIASRFGRQALDLYGDFYKKQTERARNDDDYEVFEHDEVEFTGCVQRYMDKQMGSQDIYTCPLCYSQMHRRIFKALRPADRRDKDSESESESESASASESESDDSGAELRVQDYENLPADSVYDPMTVVGYLDSDSFRGASLFCFTKVANLKKHLRGDHGVDTRGIEGNDLYMRFRVRAADGLLQRYLKTSWSSTWQGDMMRYWNYNKQNFLYLLHQMERAEFYLQIVQADDVDEEDEQEARTFLSVGWNFFRSFRRHVQREWERISSPFLKVTRADLDDFLVEEGSVEGEDEAPHFLAHRQLMNEEGSVSDENDLLHKIQRKYAESDSSSEDDDDDDEGVQEYSEVSEIEGYYSEIEEEKDEWVKNIQSQRKARKRNKGRVRRHSEPAPVVGKKLTKRKSSTPPKTNTPVITPLSKRRPILLDDSDEILLDDSDDE